MLNADTNIPSNRVPFFDQVTGLISREWYRYFLALLNANVDYAPQSDPVNVPLTASPLTIGNDTQRPLDVMISGGGVIKVEFQRGPSGTKYNTGSYYGMFGLSPNDGLTITYSGTPIITLISR